MHHSNKNKIEEYAGDFSLADAQIHWGASNGKQKIRRELSLADAQSHWGAISNQKFKYFNPKSKKLPIHQCQKWSKLSTKKQDI